MFIFYCVRMIDFSIDIFGNLRIVFTLWDRVFLNVFFIIFMEFYIYILRLVLDFDYVMLCYNIRKCWEKYMKYMQDYY